MLMQRAKSLSRLRRWGTRRLVRAQVKAAKAREEQMLAGVAKAMANADAVHLMGLRTMEKTKRDVREVFAPFPVDVKQAAAGRAFLKVAGKNSQGANVEEDEENTEITAE